MTQIDQGWLRYYIGRFGRSLKKTAAAPFWESSHNTECSVKIQEQEELEYPSNPPLFDQDLLGLCHS